MRSVLTDVFGRFKRQLRDVRKNARRRLERAHCFRPWLESLEARRLLAADPTLDALSNLTIDEDAAEQTVPLTGISAGGGESQPLRVTASSSPPGTFGVATNFAVGTKPISVSVGDFNGDGIQDLVTANQDTDTVSILLGNGDGTFGAATNFAAGDESFSVAVADFNGDGIKDLAVANRIDDTVSVLLGEAGIIPNPTVTYTSADATGTLKFTPVADQHGTATITVTVEDGGLDGDLDTGGDNGTFSRDFVITVNAVNDNPTLNALSDLTILEDASEQTVSLTGISAGGGESQSLRVTTTSSKTSLIAHPAVTYTFDTDRDGTLKFTPVADQSGTATITVTVEDGGLDGDLDTGGDNGTFSRTFDVTVNAVNDGPTLVVSSGLALGDEILGTVYWEENGHTYQVIKHAAPLEWHDAAKSASDMTFNGVSGYLATFTSSTEWEFVLAGLLEPNRRSFGNGWIGATDEVSEGTFSWVTGESFSFSSPATFDNLNNEDYATVWRFGVNDPLQWNDVTGPGQRSVVEFGDGIVIDEDAGEHVIDLSGITAGNGETQPLKVTAASDNPGLIPDPVVVV